MNKSERRSRRDTVNNFYVPPPARNRNVDGSECHLPAPTRKLEKPDCYASNTLKTTERAPELRVKVTPGKAKPCNNSSLLFNLEADVKKSEETKLCNNSSLLFNLEDVKKTGQETKLCNNGRFLFNIESEGKKIPEEIKLCNNSSLLFNIDNDMKKSAQETKICNNSSLLFHPNDVRKQNEDSKLCNNSGLLFNLDCSVKKETKLCNSFPSLFNIDSEAKRRAPEPKLNSSRSLLFNIENDLKKTSEETKLCNNSSLLFMIDDAVPQCGPGIESQSRKRRRKKKKKEILSESKIEYQTSNDESNVMPVTSPVQDISFDESLNDSSNLEDKSRILSQDQSPVNPSINSPPIMEAPCHNSNSPIVFQIMESLSLQGGMEIKCMDSDIDVGNLSKSVDQSKESIDLETTLPTKEKSVSLEESDACVYLALDGSENENHCDVEEEYEWEKLLDDEFQDFDLKTSPKKDGPDGEKCMKICASEPEKESSDCSIIEIYGFPEELKTQDLLMSFSSFVNRGFKLKWVDNTHALGIFPAPSIAEEALKSSLPFVKTRPLSQACEASKEKAQRVILPPALRPKTCAALARRLVSGALGVRAVFTKEEREAEREMLKEAREQKRLAAKQRDAAWEGKF